MGQDLGIMETQAPSEASGPVSWSWEAGSGTFLSLPAPALHAAAPAPVTEDALLRAVHVEDQDTVRALWRGALPGADYRVLAASGTCWVRSRTAVRRDVAGRVTRVDGVDLDITDLVQAQASSVAEARRARILASVAAQLGQDPDLQVLGRVLCEAVRSTLPVDGVTLRSYAPDTDEFTSVASSGAGATPRPVPGPDYRALVAALGPTACIPDVGRHPQLGRDADYYRKIGLVGLAYAVVERANRLVGMIVVASFGRPLHLSPEDLELLRALASHGALALANAELLQESRRTAERYRNIVDTAEEGICIVDRDGFLRFANPQLARMLGRTVEEMLGQPVALHVHPEDRGLSVGSLAERMEGGRGTQRWRLLHADGRTVHVVTHSSALHEDGRPVGVLILASDVTESDRVAEKLRQAQQVDSLGVLAGGIAHDFNNLLVSVLGNVELALMEVPGLSPLRPLLQDVQSAAVRAAELTRQLLAYAGKGRLVLAPLDLHQLLRDAEPALQALARPRVNLRVHADPELPRLHADAQHLRQVLGSLVSNAVEALGDTPGSVSLRVSALNASAEDLADTYGNDRLPPGLYLRLDVEDTGPGMSPETLGRIFQPFFSTRFAGRGLGLPATLGILRAHRGGIKVRSQPGRGACFTVFLPAGTPPAAPAVLGAPAGSAAGNAILVVDDEEVVRVVAARALQRAGFQVLTAEDGVQAVEVFRAHASQVRLVVLDLTMPRLSGVEAFQQLRAIRPGVPIILASGYGEQEATGRFDGKGLAGFLEKPFPPSRLLRKVEEVLHTGAGPLHPQTD